jgi:orotate phosphoribosyltransferase
MHLIPTNEEVIGLLRETGALRQGHFEYPNGMHTNEYLQVALAFRYFQNAKILSVGLSRRLRADAELRAMIKELSIVCPNTGGLPIAYGLCEALRAHQVYWADQDSQDGPMRFLRSGRRLTQLRKLVESSGATVVGMAVAVYQPNPSIADFGSLPLIYLAKMDAVYYKDSSICELCHKGVPVEKIWV